MWGNQLFRCSCHGWCTFQKTLMRGSSEGIVISPLSFIDEQVSSLKSLGSSEGIVISPLRSFIDEQVSSLKSLGCFAWWSFWGVFQESWKSRISLRFCLDLIFYFLASANLCEYKSHLLYFHEQLVSGQSCSQYLSQTIPWDISCPSPYDQTRICGFRMITLLQICLGFP